MSFFICRNIFYNSPISISSKKVIPYIEKILFTQSKIDDEIYTELKNNLSDEFAELRKQLLEEFK